MAIQRKLTFFCVIVIIFVCSYTFFIPIILCFLLRCCSTVEHFRKISNMFPFYSFIGILIRFILWIESQNLTCLSEGRFCGNGCPRAWAIIKGSIATYEYLHSKVSKGTLTDQQTDSRKIRVNVREKNSAIVNWFGSTATVTQFKE